MCVFAFAVFLCAYTLHPCPLRYDWMKEGRDVVRVFDKNSLSWQTLPGVKLSEYRWYPTQVRNSGLRRRHLTLSSK